MQAPVLIGVIVLASALVFVLFVVKGPLRSWARCPIVLRRGHLIVLAVGLTLPACIAMLVSLAGRVKLNDEIRRSQITRSEVKSLARPSIAEQLARINKAFKVCSSDERCRVAFVRTVNRVIRSPAGRLFTVAPPKAPVVQPPPARSEPAPPPVTKTVIVQAPPAAQPPAAAPAPAPRPPIPGKNGKAGKNAAIDSALLATLDHRLTDLEGVVGQLGTTVAGVNARLGALLGRVCALLRICQ